ncbi:MAG: hypothetical protein OEN55_00310 [Alphaproteobacteria bacterium]|nr:hypothetical protein [Alphaproteobacteria bacterium]
MHRLFLAAALTTAVAAAGAAATAAGDESDGIILTITSSPSGTAFSAICTLTSDGVQTVEDHSGTAPVTLRFDADWVRCELSSAGPLDVVADGPRGNRTRTSTSGGRITLAL